MIRLYFGQPGSGKTTLACRNLFKLQRKFSRKKYDHYYANFPNELSVEFDARGLGEWTFPERSYVVIDEAGIEYNSRKFKSMSHEFISWIKLHRHYRCDVDFISQSWEDVDITIRRLADELWHIKRLGPVTLVRRVYKFVTVDENTHQIIDGYQFGKAFKRFLPPPFYEKNWYFVFRPRYYKYFDTCECPALPVRYADDVQLRSLITRKPSRLSGALARIKRLFRRRGGGPAFRV